MNISVRLFGKTFNSNSKICATSFLTLAREKSLNATNPCPAQFSVSLIMESAEKISVKWNDFDQNILRSFSQLRSDIEFADVTLVCEDGHQVLAHKVVLTSASNFFMNILRRTLHPHPLIYMRGFTAEDLVPIVDLLYLGEMNIDRANLPTLLSLAMELQINGFTGDFLQGRHSSDFGDEEDSLRRQTVIKKGVSAHNADNWDQSENWTLREPVKAATEIKHVANDTVNQNVEPQEANKMENLIKSERADNFHFDQLITESDGYKLQMKQLDAKIVSMMEFSANFLPTKAGQRNRKERKRICKLCGKEDKMGDIKRHIEAKHFTGLLHLCGICGQILGTRYKLARHKSKKHGK